MHQTFTQIVQNEAYFKEKNIINYLYKNNNLKIEIVSKAT